ncbi:MAG: right-handed parallel beta-helix repeat-containing protein [Verrucomicrobia bacterium]|nr:right-handed parallel beta-helix repeat-containing protein [Verrucomicrobiota bacterium]
MKTFLKTLFVTLLSLPWFASLRAATYYCDPATGSMSNPGTSTSPWSTLEAVFAAGKTFQAGDVINLRNGYHGFPNITGNNSGNVTIQAQSGHTPTAKKLSASNASRWVVAGLTISPEVVGSYERGNFINLPSSCSFITVQSCLIYSAQSISGWTATDWVNRAGTGIQVSSANTVLLNNTVKHIGFGISLGKSAVNSQVTGNLVDHFCYDGLRGLADDCIFDYNIVRHNYNVSANHNDGFQSWSLGPTGNVGEGVVARVTLRGNIIINVQDPSQPLKSNTQAIGCFDGFFDNWIVENNLIIVDHWHGISLYGARNCRIVNNTVIKNPLNNFSSQPWIGVFAHKNGTPSSGNTIRNNLATDFSLSGTFTSDFNIETAAYTSHFVNYAGFDFHLKSGSTAINAGTTSLAPTIDLDKRTRTVPYDVGCYEFASGDTTPPTVSITAPASGALLRGTAVTVSANASDNVGVVGVQFKLDGANLGAEDTSSPYSITWNTTTASNGSHTLTAVARDAAGNTTTSAGVTVTVDNSAPTASITAPANGATVSGASVAVSASASDNVGVVGVQFKLDGANLGAEDTTSPYSISWNTTTASNGSHTLTAVARDAAGNSTTSSAITVTVSNGDTTPPTVSITAPSAGLTVRGTAGIVSASASDNVGVVGVQFKVDGANLGAEDTSSPYSISWNTLNSANGNHSLTAVARDAAGNTTTSAAVTVTVSNSSTLATGGGSWANVSFDNQAATFTAEWDATPSANNMDAAMGLSNGAVPSADIASSYTNLAAIVRFWTTGFIEARNGGTYTAANAIPYSANIDYHFRLVVNVPAHTYSAYVTPVGGTEQTIGLNYAFRTEQSGATQLNNLGCRASATGTSTEVLNVIAADSALKVWLKFDEIAGLVAPDTSKNNNDGTLVNGALWSTGGLGGAVELDGVNDHVTLPSGQANYTGGLTIAVWAYPQSVGSYARFIDFGNGAGSDNIYLSRDGTTSGLRFKVFSGATGGNAVVAANAIALNQWQHFAATLDSSGNVKLYKDGAQVATGTTLVPLNVNRANNFIGRSNWTGDAYFDGAFDDLRIYNRVLSAAEILALP